MSAATSSTNMATSIRLSSLPDGLFESQLRDFFNQFGTVTAVRLMRSKKTNTSRGVAYVRFEFANVAQIAADTMNNYLCFGQLIKCRTVRELPQDVYNPRFLVPVPKNWSSDKHAKVYNKAASNVNKKSLRRKARNQRAKNEKLRQLGIQYSMETCVKKADVEDEKKYLDVTTDNEYTLIDDNRDEDISFATPPCTRRTNV